MRLTAKAKMWLLGLTLAGVAVGLLYVPTPSLFVFLASGCLAALALSFLTNAPNAPVTYHDLERAEHTLLQAVHAEGDHFHIEPNSDIARVLNHLVQEGFVRSHAASGAAVAAYGVVDRRHAIEALGGLARAKAASSESDRRNLN